MIRAASSTSRRRHIEMRHDANASWPSRRSPADPRDAARRATFGGGHRRGQVDHHDVGIRRNDVASPPAPATASRSVRRSRGRRRGVRDCFRAEQRACGNDAGLTEGAAEPFSGGQASSIARRPASAAPTGAPSPFEKDTITVSAQAANRATATPVAASTFQRRAPSRCSGTPIRERPPRSREARRAR